LFSIIFENNTEYKVDLDFLVKIAQELSLQNKEIEFILTTNNDIQAINLTTRGIDKPTDVLSFPYENMPHTPLGSIMISSDFTKEKSALYGHSFDDELALLFIHGLLHLIGYDHEIDNGEHREKEKQLIKQFNLPSSLIVRTNKEE
jgi:probable rRNA maturation factor